MSDNSITITGNLTRDPELKYTTTAKAVVSLGVAVSRRYQVNGEWTEQTSFFNVTAWGQLAENVAQSLSKGCRVVVFGRLEQRVFQGKDGAERSVVEIIADDIGASLKWATAQVTRNDRTDTQPYTGKTLNADFPTDEEPF